MKPLFKIIKSLKPVKLIKLIRPISLIKPIKFIKPARYKFITACLVLSLALGGLFFTASQAHAGWPSWLKAPVVFVKKALAVVGGSITGEGTISFLPLFTGAVGLPSNTIGDSIVYDDGVGHVGVATTNPTKRLDIKQLSDSQSTGAGLSVMNTAGTGYTQLMTGADNTSYLFNGIGGYMTLTNAGNVGIGTVSPGAKLEVAGQIKITGGTPGLNKVLTSSDASGLAVWSTPGGLPAGTSGQTLRHNGTDWIANSVLYNNGTNVGIGTASPNNKLTVTGAANISSFLRVGGNTGGAALAGDIVARRSANTGAYYFGDSASNYLYFDGTNYQFGLGGLYVNTSGNVGIGTAAPRAPLEVNGSMILTPLAADPVGPVNGQMWMRQ